MANFHEIIKVPDGALAWIYLFSENLVGEVSPHWHDSLELTFLVQGQATYWVNGKELQLKKGELVLINSGDMHSCTVPPKTCEAVNIMFPSRFFAWFGKSKDLVLFKKDTAKKQHQSLIQCCEKLYHVFAMRTKDAFSQLKINSIVCEIAYILLANFQWDEFAPLAIESAKYRRRCREIVEYIDLAYKDDITMENLSFNFGISKEHLSRIFRVHMGTTFKKHLTRVRMYNAYKMLTNSDLSVIDIAVGCGFSDSRAFIASFNKVYKTTPGKYRRALYQDISANFGTAKMSFFFEDSYSQ